jgi:uracil-DNA glycosylase family 4
MLREGRCHRPSVFKNRPVGGADGRRTGPEAVPARAEVMRLETNPGSGRTPAVSLVPVGSNGPEWDRLSAEIRSCTLCDLHRTRTQAVVYRGGRSPRVVFIGEAPGAEEDRRGEPFVGRSGRRLDEAIAQMGLSQEQFGIVNLLKCRPPKNVFARESARTCRPYLERQLDLLRPKVVVPLGAHALAAMDRTAPRITDAAGVPRHGARWTLFPLLHPAATFRSRKNLERWGRDVVALGSALAGG